MDLCLGDSTPKHTRRASDIVSSVALRQFRMHPTPLAQRLSMPWSGFTSDKHTIHCICNQGWFIPLVRGLPCPGRVVRHPHSIHCTCAIEDGSDPTGSRLALPGADTATKGVRVLLVIRATDLLNRPGYAPRYPGGPHNVQATYPVTLAFHTDTSDWTICVYNTLWHIHRAFSRVISTATNSSLPPHSGQHFGPALHGLVTH